MGDRDFGGSRVDGVESRDAVAIRGDHLARAIDRVGAIARVGGLSIGQGDFEKAVAFDGKIHVVARFHQRPLLLGAGGSGHPGAVTHLHATHFPVGAGRSRRDQGGIQQILEANATALESARVHVGQVVGNHVQGHFLGSHSGDGRP